MSTPTPTPIAAHSTAVRIPPPITVARRRSGRYAVIRTGARARDRKVAAQNEALKRSDVLIIRATRPPKASLASSCESYIEARLRPQA